MIEIFLILFLSLLGITGLSMTVGWKNLHYRLLSHDIKKWQREGWVDAEGAQAILRDSKPKGLGGRLVFLVGFLGALLLLFAAISFVAANWDDMSRLSRLTWLMVMLWIVYLIGWRFTANKHPLLAEIAIFLGIGLFGVNIALIAQMFHIDSHPPGGILMWTIGALVSATLLQSRAALVLTFIGALTWSLMESLAYDVLIHWPFLIIWGGGLALSIWWRWSYAYHLAFLSLIAWAIVNMVAYAIEGHWSPHGVMVLFIMLFLFILAVSFVLQANRLELELGGFESWLEKYAILGLLPALFGLQTIPFKLATGIYGANSAGLQGHLGWLPLTLFLLTGTLILLFLTWREKRLRKMDLVIFAAIAGFTLCFALVSMPGLLPDTGMFISSQTHTFLATWIYGAAFLSMLIWLITFGHRRGSDLYVWVALLAFAGEVLYIYIRIFGSLLETSLFFLVGGLLTLGLAFFLYRLHQRLDEPDQLEREDKRSEATS